MLFVSYPNLIAIVPPNITSFVGWNERNKVGVRDGGGAKRKRSTETYEKCCYTRMRARQCKVQQYNDAQFSSITCCTTWKIRV